MNKFLKITLLAASGMFSSMTLACTQNNNSIGMVGLDHPSGTVYVSVTSSSGQCSCSTIRFTSANTDTKMVLSILLAAKMAEKKVRIDFLDINNCNSANRVYVQ
ncbi:hypothetical protein [Cellvibrio sp. PSBB023]|uniref:hypothetical protein n=1 Tax=Cellvibrio sp. PSBB023 TaxID=1945512 RepID=UPI00098F627F|nr:hypothetical protein [Cellvibrio sp. PSBB023]AQT59185.1 hypothetical protein B0D95_03095 [Cellvibrio sp. PSBB023]